MRFNLLEKNEFPESFEHAWNIYRNIQEMIKLADQKVYVSATVSLVLCTLIGAIATITALKPEIIPKIIIEKNYYAIFFLSVFLVSTGAFVLFSLLSLRARFDSHSDAAPNLIFFGDISARRESSEYITDYLGLTSKDAMEDLLYQIYIVSAIATKKHKYYNLACYGLFSQLLFFILILAGYIFLLFK